MLPLQPFKRKLLQVLGLLPLHFFTASAQAASAQGFKIAFGSCLHQDKPQPIWDAILHEQPDLFVFLGDNIYGDTDDMSVLAAKYAQLAAQPGFQALRTTTEIQAIWDDHDYGRNDAGREYPMKAESRELMLDFWNEAADSPRRRQPDGIYTSWTSGPAGQSVQLILLDLRWNRSPLAMVPQASLAARNAMNMGPYTASTDSAAVLLGEAQWQWLEQQMEQPADLRIIGSSIQLLPEFTGWESWANFPQERERMLALLARHQQVPALILSGDVHWCELSALPDSRFARPLLELTSSGLTEVWEQISPNQYRSGEAFATENFGVVNIDWDLRKVQLAVKDMHGLVLVSHDMDLPR